MSLKIKTWLIAAFAVVVTCSVGVVQWYQLKCMTHLQEEVYVVSKSELARNLLKGARPEEYAYELLRVDEDEPVYQRGFDLYVGEGKDKIQGDFPFFTNDGNAIMIMQDTPVLYNTEFDEVSTFQGMYLSDGISFNYDKTQADEDEFLFLKLKNGLFMNTQSALFAYPGGESHIGMNAVLYLGEEDVRFYAMGQDNVLHYGELPTTKLMTVTIGGQTYSYEQLLEQLGIVAKSKEVISVERDPELMTPVIPEMEDETDTEDGEEDDDLSEDKELKDLEDASDEDLSDGRSNAQMQGSQSDLNKNQEFPKQPEDALNPEYGDAE